MTKAFDHAHLSQLEALPGPGTLTWRPVRRHFDIRAFGINAYTSERAGQDVVEDHTEASNGHEELYVVLAGRARFTVGGKEIDAPAGTLVFLRDPQVRRSARAEEAGTTVLAIGGKAGEAYQPSAWEFWFAAEPHRRAGDYAKAAEVVAGGLAEHPRHAPLLYNLACYEALAGQRERAVEHLRQAIEVDPKFREEARLDVDFDSMREERGFAELVGG
jgi:tetratricopeptide (TPR) repeat protein